MMWFMNGLGRTGIQGEQTGYHSSYMDANSYLNACSWLCPSSCQDSKNNTKFHTCPHDNAEHTNGLSSSSSILVLWVSVVHSWSCLSKNKLSSYN